MRGLRRPTSGDKCCTDHVLVIDTSALYLCSYEAHSVDRIKSLDDIRVPADVLAFREELWARSPPGRLRTGGGGNPELPSNPRPT